jgi:hypothetical protein
MPKQGGGSRPASYYFPKHSKHEKKGTKDAEPEIPDDHRTAIMPPGPSGKATTKSSANRLLVR